MQQDLEVALELVDSQSQTSEVHRSMSVIILESSKQCTDLD